METSSLDNRGIFFNDEENDRIIGMMSNRFVEAVNVKDTSNDNENNNW